jgi:hypothetical protein
VLRYVMFSGESFCLCCFCLVGCYFCGGRVYLFCSALLIYWSRSGSDPSMAESALASCMICGPVLENLFCHPAYSVDLALILVWQNSFCFALEGLLAFLLVCYCRSISWCDFLLNFVSAGEAYLFLFLSYHSISISESFWL